MLIQEQLIEVCTPKTAFLQPLKELAFSKTCSVQYSEDINFDLIHILDETCFENASSFKGRSYQNVT